MRTASARRMMAAQSGRNARDIGAPAQFLVEALLGAKDEICRRISRGMAVKAIGPASAAGRCVAAAGTRLPRGDDPAELGCTSAASGWPKMARTRVAAHD